MALYIMFKELVIMTLVISVLLISVRSAFTIKLNYLASTLTFYLLFTMYISPTTLLIFGR